MVALAVLALLAIALGILALKAPASADQSNSATSYPTVQPVANHPMAVFVGGSFTAGAGSSSTSASWASLVAKARGWRFVNLASSANDIFSVTTKCPTGCPDYKAMVASVIAVNPRIVVIGAQLDESADQKVVATTAASALRALRLALPNAYIIAVGPTGVPGAETTKLQTLDSSFHAAATASGAIFVSLLTPTGLGPTQFAAGNLGPNDGGQALISRRVQQALS
jgi:hypothetical protein